MLLVDVQERKVTRDEELKLSLATSRPLGSWLKQMVSSAPVPGAVALFLAVAFASLTFLGWFLVDMSVRLVLYHGNACHFLSSLMIKIIRLFISAISDAVCLSVFVEQW